MQKTIKTLNYFIRSTCNREKNICGLKGKKNVIAENPAHAGITAGLSKWISYRKPG